MASHSSDFSGQVRRISELDNYTIEKGDADPRGWSVVGTNGHPVGTVVDLLVDTGAMKVRQLLVEATGTGQVSDEDTLLTLDVADVDLREGAREVFARNPGVAFDRTSQSYAPSYGNRTAAGEAGDVDETRITRTEEELRIGTREVSRGEVRVGKHVETERVSQPVTTRREEVVIERRPVEAGARGDATISDDEIRIPLTEEEVVVEKRPVVKEELVIGKRVVEEREVVEADVRREQFDIDETAGVVTREPGKRSGER